MKKKIHILGLVSLFCLLGFYSQAQTDTNPVDNPEEVLQDLIDETDLDGGIGDQFVLRSSRNIGPLQVIVYDQVLDGYIIEDQFVAILLNEEGEVQFTHETVRPLDISSAPRVRIGQRKLSRIVASQFRGEASIVQQELLIVNGEEDILAYKLLVKTENPENYYSIYVNASSGSIHAFENLTNNTGKSVSDEEKIIKAIGDQCGCNPQGFQNVCLYNPDPVTAGSSTPHTANSTSGGSVTTLANSADLAEYFPLSVPSAISHNSDKFCCNGTGQGAPDYRITFCHFHLNEYLSDMQNCISGISVIGYNVSANIGETAFYNGTSIEYGSDVNNPMAEDLFHVIHGANQYLVDILNSGLSGSVKAGTLDYLSMVYKNNDYPGNDLNECWSYSGPTSRRTDVAYNLNNGCGFSSGDDNDDGQWWSTVLTDLESVIGQALVKELALSTIQMVSSADFQEKAAQIFYDAADAHSGISNADLCNIYVVLENQYGTCFTNLVERETDYFIHDDANDIGNEPNTQTTQFWISPDIWNCHSDPNCTSHENPEYGIPNYLKVRVTGLGCVPFTGGQVQAHYSAASTGHSWDVDWYASTSGGLGSELTPVSIPAIAEGDVEIVTVNWDPPNPIDINPSSTNNTAHVCLLARIVSTDDPMFDEVINQNAGIGHNNKYNNNNAMKNMTIFNSGGFLKPAPPEEAVIIVRNVLKEEQEFVLEITADNFNLEELDQGDIEIRLTDEIYEEWERGGAKGEGFERVRGALLKVKGRKLVLYGLRLKPRHPYRVGITYRTFEGVREVKEFDFDLVQKTNRGKVIGGNRFLVRQNKDERDPRKQLKSLATYREMSLFPNPVHDELHVQLNLQESDATVIEIFDATGMLRQIIKKPNSQSILKIDVSAYQNGLYYLSLQKSDGTKETTKFFKN